MTVDHQKDARSDESGFFVIGVQTTRTEGNEFISRRNIMKDNVPNEVIMAQLKGNLKDMEKEYYQNGDRDR